MDEFVFPDPALQGNGIMLRPWRQGDVSAIVAACSDPRVTRFLTGIPDPYTDDDARAWLATHEPNHLTGAAVQLAIAELGDETAGESTVASVHGGEAVGSIEARLDHPRRSASIGYWLAPSAQGRGHMTSAVRLLCGWLFQSRGIERIELTTAPENDPSQRVAERCGFQQEGLLRSYLRNPHTGVRRDSLMWSLLPGDEVRAQPLSVAV